MSSGKIVQIIGAVVDVEFPREAMPKVYDALKVDDNGLTLETQQQLGDGVVRTIAMGTTDGMARYLSVTNTGAPITMPVGQKTLGRIMDVLGQPVDENRLVKTKGGQFTVKRLPLKNCLPVTSCWKPVLR